VTLEKCVAVIMGTEDIHQPLYRSLKSALSNEVYLIQSHSRGRLRNELAALAERYEVWVFASNEFGINVVHEAVKGTGLIDVGKVRIPGTAFLDRVYTSAEVCNKAILYSLLESCEFNTFRKVKTQIWCWNGDDGQLGILQGCVNFPVVIKPAAKDDRDSFTSVFPGKIVVLEDWQQLCHLVREKRDLFCDKKLLLQELVKGVNVSWFGYACGGHAEGYWITAVVKSPVGSFGGTTTLARLERMDPRLSSAVDELVKVLNLDGIFEIEFILQGGKLHFFYEINPRPILQVALVLQQRRNIFVEYLSKKGFTLKSNYGNPQVLPNFWGSASRYLRLNAKKQISPAILLRTAVHDVRYSKFFHHREKISYTFCLARLLLQCVTDS